MTSKEVVLSILPTARAVSGAGGYSIFYATSQIGPFVETESEAWDKTLLNTPFLDLAFQRIMDDASVRIRTFNNSIRTSTKLHNPPPTPTLIATQTKQEIEQRDSFVQPREW